ncbi:FHA domain-containing protein [Tuwongella immobilis]|uniref:FHA domain-containing protein n=1 Tax=Tuwongella immobilis TaxID=692036 RepID=A0A6C2YW11_9BACT|nr:FHA domain-containing protein [Tuwongella immobilis]VIP05052.1 fha domain-containing protein : FHA domain-containing protein OS=Singulisphaera acidiphila (strain ATCC BAA-1392 / DSM 18658 / VKM B-2454 / MOB10) GN=Sinac_3216 PE=4 SV=1: FHA [Tuwongella immobilis]VTS07460.1 fha domain-containing protein : FHA domain-containing protein OS=Singulisphaera acidiphila (strain ATCC BAA-1392 / DSM 18658 / VKM B-2454 / MOB10) GN=Sinac_3216 PE=4 SV=1: FHA [Tuwongella immobilis]
MPAQLLALSEGSNILLDKPILLLGRHPECDIQLNSRKVSRIHCCLAQVHDYLVVRDLGSTNGVRINGVRVVEGKVHAGDELTIGNFRYQVVWDGPDGPPSDRRKLPKGLVGSPSAASPGAQPAAHLPSADPKASAPVIDEDSMLEDSDEPIPLPAPANGKLLPAQPVDPRSGARMPKPLTESNDPPPADDGTEQQSILLPEHLTLLPPKDSSKIS